MLTAEGVDFVESQRVNIPILNKLLTTGSGPLTTDGAAGQKALNSSPTPIIVPASHGDSGGNEEKEDVKA
jgi:hypothetical protein